MTTRRSRYRAPLLAALIGLTTAIALAAPLRADDAETQEKTGTLRVSAVDFKGTTGQAVIAVYRRGKSWLSVGGAYRVAKVTIKDGKASATFRNMPHDAYGVAVVHDANMNGKLDMSYFPYPSPDEGGGVSNNWVRDGKPEYDKAKFDLSRSLMSVRIMMRY